jgi:ABC-type multidrug transport system permease subunit
MEGLVYFSILAFLFAGGIELASNRSRAEKLRSSIPIILGIASFFLNFEQDVIYNLTPSLYETFRLVMMIFSAIIACSGVFITYSRPSSAISVACGGLLLTFLWMFTGLVF